MASHTITPDTPAEVAVIGGGAAGTLAAVHLLRAGARGPVAIVERADRLGRGVAYSTTFPDHLLNVVAANLGGLSGEPGHFRDWLAERGEPADAGAFLPRMVFGRYLTALLGQAADAHPGVLASIRAEAIGLAADGDRIRVELADGSAFTARHVILATGTPAAPDVPLESGRWPQGSARYLSDPWAVGALDALPGGRDVLLVGTGLTTVDVALRLVDAR
ncbi:MAG TPA: FAD/NAD(P)-binding protein, partial [Gaiellales bacterium]